ncbi:MAG TPA: hypothetical protein VFQ07_05330 [Candidatus Polarisedimenticolia bacterium]|nr:hypothetical protein [Candidatus Polarisedimenticolia bacterium]
MTGGSDPGPEDPYLLAIEETFNRRRGAPHLLSPRDWALADSWRKTGVPLRLVLQGIENCFDAFERRAPGPRRINSLSYCRQEVLSLYDLYLGLHGPEAGRPAAATADDGASRLAKHLGRLGRRLKEAMTRASTEGRDALVGSLAEALAEVRRMAKDLKGTAPSDPAAVEAALDRLDAALLARAHAVLPEEERTAIDREIDAALGSGADRMSGAALLATRAAARARRLRQHAGLPRLSLFD